MSSFINQSIAGDSLSVDQIHSVQQIIQKSAGVWLLFYAKAFDFNEIFGVFIWVDMLRDLYQMATIFDVCLGPGYQNRLIQLWGVNRRSFRRQACQLIAIEHTLIVFLQFP